MLLVAANVISGNNLGKSFPNVWKPTKARKEEKREKTIMQDLCGLMFGNDYY